MRNDDISATYTQFSITELKMEMSAEKEAIQSQSDCSYSLLFCYCPSTERLSYAKSEEACVDMDLSLLVMDSYQELLYVALNIVKSDVEGYRTAAWNRAVDNETSFYWNEIEYKEGKRKRVSPKFLCLFPSRHMRGLANNFLCITFQKIKIFQFTSDDCELERKYICKGKRLV